MESGDVRTGTPDAPEPAPLTVPDRTREGAQAMKRPGTAAFRGNRHAGQIRLNQISGTEQSKGCTRDERARRTSRAGCGPARRWPTTAGFLAGPERTTGLAAATADRTTGLAAATAHRPAGLAAATAHRPAALAAAAHPDPAAAGTGRARWPGP